VYSTKEQEMLFRRSCFNLTLPDDTLVIMQKDKVNSYARILNSYCNTDLCNGGLGLAHVDGLVVAGLAFLAGKQLTR
jgi:hypothetical protein